MARPPPAPTDTGTLATPATLLLTATLQVTDTERKPQSFRDEPKLVIDESEDCSHEVVLLNGNFIVWRTRLSGRSLLKSV